MCTVLNRSSKVDKQHWTLVLSRIFVRPKRIFATTVRLIARNFSDNRTIWCSQISPILPLEIREFWRISEKFAIITFAQCCWRPNCHYCWNVSQVVWSTTSFVSLTIHSTGWEDNNKLMNGPIARGSGVLVCCLKSVFFFFFFFFFFLRTVVWRTASIFHVWRPNCQRGPFIHDIYITVLAPVVQMLYSAINRINHYPVDKYYGYQLRGPLDWDLPSG